MHIYSGTLLKILINISKSVDATNHQNCLENPKLYEIQGNNFDWLKIDINVLWKIVIVKWHT